MVKKEEERHWADIIAKKLVELHPRKSSFVCAAGTSPSGVVHIGNFRDIITSDVVSRALKDKKCKVKLLFFWDDYDRFRKVPAGVPKAYSKFIGMPISKIPDPHRCHKSYAEHFEREFEESMSELGIKAKFISQTKEYEKNKYYKEIKTALQKRKQIAEILARFKTQSMTKKSIENYYPLQVYCRKCGKDSTKIIDYDGENIISYSCKCGHKERINISKQNIGKLGWKVDWAMRWAHYNVSFEPGGKDLAIAGGSYDVSKTLAKEIFNAEPPLFQGYEFVGIAGISKMSSSGGTGIPPKNLLEIYEPSLLRWLFTKANPMRPLTFCFDSELIRQYNEFYKEVKEYFRGKLSGGRKRSLIFAKIEKKEFARKSVPFRQVATFGQIVQGNLNELKKMFKKMKLNFEEASLRERLKKSQNWIQNFAPQLEIKVRDKPNLKYYKKLSKEEKEQIDRFRKGLDKNWSLKALTSFVYTIPKKPNLSESEKKKRQRNFFKNIYQMLISSDTGPRLPTFLLALGKQRVKNLLKVNKK